MVFLFIGIFSLSGTSIVTYLYGAYVVPLRPIFVLLWFAALILTAGGFIGHCFHLITSLMASARRVVAPMPLESGSVSLYIFRLNDKQKTAGTNSSSF